MNLNDLTLGQARELAALFGTSKPADSPWVVGANYLIRTVTMIDAGTLVRVTEHELVLKDASWIADTGRFADALKAASFGEVEPFPDGEVIIGRGAVIDAVQIKLVPRSQK